MKKKIISFLLAGVLAAASVAPVAAATITDVTVFGSTEVTASISDPGQVSYTITIPETADFGTLTIPENTDTAHYAFCNLQVEATELNILSNQGVSVYMKDSISTDNKFYISQKKDVENPFKIAYDVYDTLVNAETVGNYAALNATTSPGVAGYLLRTFLYGTEGKAQTVTLALNQNALYGQTLSDIAGDYSGRITFHSALIER